MTKTKTQNADSAENLAAANNNLSPESAAEASPAAAPPGSPPGSHDQVEHKAGLALQGAEPAQAEMEVIADTTRAYWVPRINQDLSDSADSIIRTGNDLLQAKEKLPHGQFEKMFQDEEVNIGLRYAEMFMHVARNQAIQKANSHSTLPASVNALYVLSKLPAGKLERAIKKGDITADMTVKEAKSLVTKLHPHNRNLHPTPKAKGEAKAQDSRAGTFGEGDLTEAFGRVKAMLDEELRRFPDPTWHSGLAKLVTDYLQ